MARNTNLGHLHPAFRERITALQALITAQSLPFVLFEGYRTPQRQMKLYAQGRTERGPIVTRAKAWQSYHQYGLAADFVIFEDDNCSWESGGALKAKWLKLQDLGRSVGLEPLSWELPHLQMSGLSIEDLQSGRTPADGDESWRSNIVTAARDWRGTPGSPRFATQSSSISAITGVQFRVIARGGLRVRSGPGTEHDVIALLSQGDIVTLIERRGDWGLVDAQGDGLADGYCHRGFLEQIAA